MTKRKHYYRLDNKNRPIPGSNISRAKKPGSGKYKELKLLCCDPDIIPCNCDFRYWVRLDANNEPVPGSLIKRNLKPVEKSAKWQEVNWMDMCCILDISPFSTILVGPTGNIPDPAGGTESWETTIRLINTEYIEAQLMAMVSVDYYINGVLVETVMGNAIDNPNHQISYTFDIVNDTDTVYTYYAVMHFEGDVSKKTETATFTLQPNTLPSFDFAFQQVDYLIMAEGSSAQFAGWVYDANGPDTVILNFEGLPSWAENPEVFSYAGVRAFRVRFNPPVGVIAGGEALNFVTVSVQDGGNPIISKDIAVIIDETDPTFYNPLIYPYTAPELLEMTYNVSPGIQEYDKTKSVISSLTFTASASVTPNMMNPILFFNETDKIDIVPGFAANRTGEGIVSIPYGETGGIARDFLMIRVLINPA